MTRSGFGTLQWLAVVVTVAVIAPAGAREVVAQTVEQGGVRLTLEKIPDIAHGTAVLLQGETGAPGDRFFIENLAITQPVSVVLMAANPTQQPLSLNLSKYRYDQSDRLGETGSSGAVAFHFRTQGEVKIQVKPQSDDAAARTRYFLIAWAGDDVRPDLPPPVVAPDAASSGTGLPTWLLLLLAGVAGGAIVLAATKWRSLRGGTSGMSVILLGAAGLGWLPVALLADATAVGSLAALRAAPEALEWEAEDAAERRAINEAGRSAIDAGLGHLDTGMQLYDTSRGFTEADAALSDVLNPDDNEFNPEYTPDGAPTLPAHCASESGPECECYARAYGQLSFVRFYLERLRAIYGATKNYTENAIEFGDSMASLPGGFGMAWPPERRGIQEAFERMGGTYDDKYEAYMRELREALNAIAACELEHHGVEDWYNRFGFVYFSFMQDRYRR